jgi:hypothetical protein
MVPPAIVEEYHPQAFCWDIPGHCYQARMRFMQLSLSNREAVKEWITGYPEVIKKMS